MKRIISSSAALFASLGLASAGLVGCDSGGGGTDGGPVEGDITAAHGDFYDFVASKIKLPMNNRDFAIDLNGDGKVDNQLGNIIGTLATQNLDAQKGVDDSVNQGSVLLLMSFQTNDATFKNDNTAPTAAGVTIYLGQKKNGMLDDQGACTGDCPKFDGSGMFAVDTSVQPFKFYGKLTNGKYASNPPVTAQMDYQVQLKIALVAGVDPLALTVHGANVTFDAATTGLTNGQIHGSIKNADVQGTIIPAVAGLLTMQVAKDPNSSTAKQILSIFDTGGCGAAKAGDGKIEACEVAGNSIIQAVLSPDVQIYDASGAYKPNKANTMKDSLSLAIGFEAVKATITGK